MHGTPKAAGRDIPRASSGAPEDALGAAGMATRPPAGQIAGMTLNVHSSPSPALRRPGAGLGAPDVGAKAAETRGVRLAAAPAVTVIGRGAPSRRTAERPAQVLIVHGQRLARAGLRVLIDADDGLAVAGEADTGEYALALVRRRLPDLVVIDLDLPGRGALETTRKIAGDPALAHVRVLVLTSAENDEAILGPIRAGAAGLLLSDSEPAELLRGLRLLAAGETPISPSLIRALIADVAARPAPPPSDAAALEVLTAREREVVALVAFGLNNHEIAQQLVISPATSRTHVSRAMHKLNVRDRAQLVAFAYQTGLAQPGANALPVPDAPHEHPRFVARRSPRQHSGAGVSALASVQRLGEAAVRRTRPAAVVRLGA
jgi:DNA-binding NarL/FixJ family response regulator